MYNKISVTSHVNTSKTAQLKFFFGSNVADFARKYISDWQTWQNGASIACKNFHIRLIGKLLTQHVIIFLISRLGKFIANSDGVYDADFFPVPKCVYGLPYQVSVIVICTLEWKISHFELALWYVEGVLCASHKTLTCEFKWIPNFTLFYWRKAKKMPDEDVSFRQRALFLFLTPPHSSRLLRFR